MTVSGASPSLSCHRVASRFRHWAFRCVVLCVALSCLHAVPSQADEPDSSASGFSNVPPVRLECLRIAREGEQAGKSVEEIGNDLLALTATYDNDRDRAEVYAMFSLFRRDRPVPSTDFLKKAALYAESALALGLPPDTAMSVLASLEDLLRRLQRLGHREADGPPDVSRAHFLEIYGRTLALSWSVARDHARQADQLPASVQDPHEVAGAKDASANGAACVASMQRLEDLREHNSAVQYRDFVVLRLRELVSSGISIDELTVAMEQHAPAEALDWLELTLRNSEDGVFFDHPVRRECLRLTRRGEEEGKPPDMIGQELLALAEAPASNADRAEVYAAFSIYLGGRGSLEDEQKKKLVEYAEKAIAMGLPPDQETKVLHYLANALVSLRRRGHGSREGDPDTSVNRLLQTNARIIALTWPVARGEPRRSDFLPMKRTDSPKEGVEGDQGNREPLRRRREIMHHNTAAEFRDMAVERLRVLIATGEMEVDGVLDEIGSSLPSSALPWLEGVLRDPPGGTGYRG